MNDYGAELLAEFLQSLSCLHCKSDDLELTPKTFL